MDNSQWYAEGRKNDTYLFFKTRFDEIQKNAKFGSDPDVATQKLAELKQEIATKWIQSLQKERKFKRAMIIAIIITVIVVFATVQNSQTMTAALLIGAGIAFVCHLLKKSASDSWTACVAFDEDFLEGEIGFRMKNG